MNLLIRSYLLSFGFLALALTPLHTFAEEPLFNLAVELGDKGHTIRDSGQWGASIIERFTESAPLEITKEQERTFIRFPEGTTSGLALNDNLKVESLGGSYTLMLWIKPEVEKRFAELISAAGDSGASESIRLRYNGWTASVDFQTGGLNPAVKVSAPDRSIPVGKWAHIAIVSDPEEVSLYVNGDWVDSAEVGEQDMTPKLGASQMMTIGNYIGRGDAYPYVGLLGEVKFFAAPMRSQEIKDEMGGVPAE